MDPLRIYQHWNPGRITFGPGSIREIGQEFTRVDRPLVVKDEGIALAGILDTLVGHLARSGIRPEIFDRVVPDPPIEVVEEALLDYRKGGCNSVIGIGGGSSMDTAKAVAVRAGGEGTLKEYGSGRPFPATIPPIVAIPTTAGTGSEVSAVAVISDPEDKMKIDIKSPALRPHLVWSAGGGNDRTGMHHASGGSERVCHSRDSG
jgi:choline dehydrogenase